MTTEQEVGASAPAGRVRRGWLAVAGALAIVAGTAWLLTPHLTSDQDPHADGTLSLGTGADANASEPSAPYETSIRVRNTGLVPVTLSEPRPEEWGGTGTTHGFELGLSRTGSAPYSEEIRLRPGEEVVVHLGVRAPLCSDKGAAESLTTAKGLVLRVQLGPISRETRVPAWASQKLVTEDGSALPACPAGPDPS